MITLTNLKVLFFYTGVFLLQVAIPIAGISPAFAIQNNRPKLGGVPLACHVQQNSYQSPPDVFPNLSKLFEHYLAANNYSVALKIIELTFDNKHKFDMLSQVANAYLDAGYKDKAIALLSQTLKLAPRVEDSSYKALILINIGNNFIKAGRQGQATESFVKSDRVMQNLMQSYKADDLEVEISQIAIGRRMPDEKVTSERPRSVIKVNSLEFQFNQVNIFEKIAEGYIAVSRPQHAIKILSQALHLVQSLPYKDPTFKAEVLAGLSIKYSLAGDQAKADDILAQSRQIAQDIPEEIIKSLALRRIADQFIGANNWKQLWEVLANNLQYAETINSPLFREIVLNDAARAWSKSNHFQAAMGIADLIQNPVFKSKLKLNIVDDLLTVPSEKEKVLAIIQDVYKVVKSIPDSSEKDDILSSIAVKYAKVGQFEQALQIANQLKSDRNQKSALSWIAIYYAKAGQPDQGLQITKRVGDDEDFLVLIVEKYIDAGYPNQVINLLSLIKFQEESTKSSQLESIAQQLVWVGQLDGALHTANLIDDVNIKNRTLALIAYQYAEAGQYLKAKEITQVLNNSAERQWLTQLLTCTQQQ
ncbi:MAG: hypothetical protein V7K72_21955 [Nostoc sp.]|uniref:tetratricopeptide repeat protein n=1 Tax=Nostoc sp. TaxID=1180 RepID=UPI002FF60D41